MASIWPMTYLGILSCFFLLPTGKAVLSSGIVGCLNYQYMHNGTCFPCPDNCRICESDTNCTQCQKGFFGPICNNTCRNNCTGTCHKVYGHCTYGCQDGYYPAEDNSCQQCQAHCSLCESQSRCVLCDDGYFGETCQETCLGHCIRCEKSLGMCSQCQDSYFLHDGQCSSCSYGCRLCNTTKNCQSCGHSFHGPVDGSCLFKCPAYDEYTYNVPDENGRCGFWQDSDTNCQFQSERQICRVTGNCLHHMDNNSSCSTVMHYNCEHKCQTNKLYLNCTAICRMRSMEKGNTSQLCLTEDGLSLFAPTFKNLEDIQCNQETGVSTGTLSTKVIIIIAVVPIVVIVVVIATSRKGRQTPCRIIPSCNFKHMETARTMTPFILLILVFLVQTDQGAYGSGILGCPIFRYMYKGSCHLCPANCGECVSDTNCTQCQKGFYGPVCENRCREGCTGTCHKVYGHCTYGCPDGEYPADRCRPCPDYCHLCESESKCVLCEDGQFGESCQETCPDRCNRCDKNIGTCLQCKNSHFFLHGQCKRCPLGCKLCAAYSNCTQCQESFYLHDGQCMSCPYGCSLCNTTADCQSCEDRFLGPVNGKCLFKCPTSAVSTYVVPEKDGRCGIWQDTNTNICHGITENHSCTSRGFCLQNVSYACYACPVESSCNRKQTAQSGCATVQQYDCSHQCQKAFDIHVCKSTCILREVDRANVNPLTMTQDALSIVALTWKNTEEAFCQNEQGAAQESLKPATLLIVVTIAYIPVIIAIIVIKRRILYKKVNGLRIIKKCPSLKHENDQTIPMEKHEEVLERREPFITPECSNV